MHLALVIIMLIGTWKWVDWKQWKKYHTTMLYISIGNLLYLFLYKDTLLWKFNYEFFSFTMGEMLYTFIILPITALIFLVNYPETLKKQILHIVKFTAAYITVEWIFYILGRITFDNGWCIWHSLAWYFMMFPMLRLHHKKPLAAYTASIIEVVLMLLIFPVNF